MSLGKDKAFLILSKLGDQRDHIISLMKPEISAIFMADFESKFTSSEELLVLQEVVSILSESLPEPVLDRSQEEEVSHLREVEESVESDVPSDVESSQEEEVSHLREVEEPVESDVPSDVLPDRVHKKSNSPKNIAKELSKQKVQIISFFLTRLEDEMLKQAIIYHFDDQLRQDIEATTVEVTPISERIYERLYDQLCCQSAGDDDDETLDKSLFKPEARETFVKPDLPVEGSDVQLGGLFS